VGECLFRYRLTWVVRTKGRKMVVVVVLVSHISIVELCRYCWRLKAKFHYASWFEAGWRQVRAKFHYTSWFEAGSKLEPASNQLA